MNLDTRGQSAVPQSQPAKPHPAPEELTVSDHDAEQYERRFKGTQTLYGSSAVDIFSAAHVYIIGVGGVGS